MRTLVDLGYVRQQPTREYVLGPRLIRLGESSSGVLGLWARPYLERLVEGLDAFREPKHVHVDWVMERKGFWYPYRDRELK